MSENVSRLDVERTKSRISGKLKRHFGVTVEQATPDQVYKAVGLTIRDEIMEKWMDGMAHTDEYGSKQV